MSLCLTQSIDLINSKSLQMLTCKERTSEILWGISILLKLVTYKSETFDF